MNDTPQTASSGQPSGAPARGEGDKGRYRSTLNLPQTPFPMKANLVQNEPASIKRWEKMGLYQRTRQARAGAPRFVFHDGPPYANGGIHLGHLMNKCLKDFVVRTRTMAGLDCPYVPGWDCHGLPIEHKVVTELLEAGKYAKLETLTESQRRMAIRRECQKYAEKWVRHQAGEFIRLLTLADYDHPYMTMSAEFEAATLEVLAALLDQGLVYRALKPVHWSIANETALAEAELEYYDREDLSIYVDFEAAEPDAVYDAFGLPNQGFVVTGVEVEETSDSSEGNGEHEEPIQLVAENPRLPVPGVRPDVRPSFMIWTTTPWTLPANLAIAVNEKFEYALVFIDGNVTVLAKDAVERVTKAAKAEDVVVLATTTGSRLVGLRYRHPFANLNLVSELRRASLGPSVTSAVIEPEPAYTVVAADYVTLEDGTGLVHTAPGHGAEDYQTGHRVGLPIYCPVKGNGTFDDTVPAFLRGMDIWKANPQIVQHLKNSGHLYYDHKFTHSYPHDWRGKSPVIFRCTEQWFIGVDQPAKRNGLSLRNMATTAVGLSGPSGAPETRTQRRIHREAAELAAEAVDTPRSDGPDPEAAQCGIERLKQMTSDPGWQTTWDLTGNLRFVPPWGRDRLRGMLESRPDWCISRQRSWGLPIPAFMSQNTSTGDVFAFMTAASVRAVARLVREKGSDCWFTTEPAELLKYYDPSTDPDPQVKTLHVEAALRDGRFNNEFSKGPDILDVWFESGSTWNAVMRERRLAYDPAADRRPAFTDLYLEGSDQHRGWFQSSLLNSLGATGHAPYSQLLTHGFMVDKDGRKMSKSLGNTLDVTVLLKDLGADVCRWWVASLAYENDIKVDRSFFDLAGESYRKIRNTLRFMLSNLNDSGAPAGAGPDPSTFTPTSLDAWVLAEFDALGEAVAAAYDRYDFRDAHSRLYDFCNSTLSSTYLAAIKDRLYCDRPDSTRRRRTQAALWHLTDGLCRLLAPVLVHTADEAYRALWKAGPDDTDRCVHLHEFARPSGIQADSRWPAVMRARDGAQIALERAKAPPQDGGLGVDNPLDAGVILPDPDGALAAFDPTDLADLLGVSQARPDRAAKEPRVLDLRDQARCERSWKRDGTVRVRSDGGLLSDRDAEALGLA